MLYFLVCADEVAGCAECHERGWTQVGAARFYTPARDDVRVIRRFTDMALLPGGTWLMAGRDFAQNPEAQHFLDLTKLGAARWMEGEMPRAAPVPMPAEPMPEEPEPMAAMPFNPALTVPSTRDNWPPRTAPELSSGGRRGPRPYRR
jgi:hypothetical protein